MQARGCQLILSLPYQQRTGAIPCLCYNPHTRGKQTLAMLSGIMRQLKRERDRVQQQLLGMNAAPQAFAGVYRARPEPNLAANFQLKDEPALRPLRECAGLK
jgi:hypothetical protein